ncbi:MAG: GNAT family N-acetyltransferase [Lactobacillales bacterium]|jgi:ribosomal protein S18 acetylase RimI-like enzyme|nr:GNAT family N-acetyltransferase [Lactobacillales bacterium]
MIRELNKTEDYPWKLLLNADPNQSLVEDYLKRGQVYVYEEQENILGVVVLMERSKNQYEVMNVSTDENHLRKGIARALLQHALTQLPKNEHLEVLVKTGDISIEAVKLYQSLGFEILETVKDYFVENYPEPIYEHGELLRNQVIMHMFL